jgi:hypothetical protein
MRKSRFYNLESSPEQLSSWTIVDSCLHWVCALLTRVHAIILPSVSDLKVIWFVTKLSCGSVWNRYHGEFSEI